MRTTAAILLAAGASRRLGRPKQLECLGSETLLSRTIRIAREAACTPVVVVLGSGAEQIQHASELDGCLVVHHADWAHGVGSSLAAGVRALPAVNGMIILTCDMPAVTAQHLLRLSAEGCAKGSEYGGTTGVPAYFPASMFSALQALDGDTGARALLASAPTLSLPGGDLDIDTEEELRRARQALSLGKFSES